MFHPQKSVSFSRSEHLGDPHPYACHDHFAGLLKTLLFADPIGLWKKRRTYHLLIVNPPSIFVTEVAMYPFSLFKANRHLVLLVCPTWPIFSHGPLLGDHLLFLGPLSFWTTKKLGGSLRPQSPPGGSQERMARGSERAAPIKRAIASQAMHAASYLSMRIKQQKEISLPVC